MPQVGLPVIALVFFIAATGLIGASFFVQNPSSIQAHTTTGSGGNGQGTVPGCVTNTPPNCIGARLSGSNLQALQLANINFSGADLSYANLQYANLENATLSDANLQGTNLSNADLLGANTNGADIGSAIYCNTVMPDGSVDNNDCSA